MYDVAVLRLSIERTNERMNGKNRTRTPRRAKKRNEPSAPSARASASTDGAQVGRLALQSSVQSLTVYTYDQSSGFFSRVFEVSNLQTLSSQRSERRRKDEQRGRSERRKHQARSQAGEPPEHQGSGYGAWDLATTRGALNRMKSKHLLFFFLRRNRKKRRRRRRRRANGWMDGFEKRRVFNFRDALTRDVVETGTRGM